MYDPMHSHTHAHTGTHAHTHTHTHTSVKLRISASSVRSRVFGGSEGWGFLSLTQRCLLKTQPILLALFLLGNPFLLLLHFLLLLFLNLQSRLLLVLRFPCPQGRLLVPQCLSVQFQHRIMSLTPSFPHILSQSKVSLSVSLRVSSL